MQDYDWIEVAFVFEEVPSSEEYESLLRALPNNPGPEYNADQYNINCSGQNSDGEPGVHGDKEEAVYALSTSEHCSIEVWLDRYGLNIGYDKDKIGFPTYSSTPYLDFATTIYSFRDSDNESRIEQVRQRRREFAKILSTSADILDPKWGFGRRGGLAIGEDETVEELASTTKPPLYEYNVFREETVEAIGREQVLSVPAYYVEELDSGGVFMAVTEPPEQCGHEDQPCEEVAEQLGLSLAKTERYH